MQLSQNAMGMKAVVAFVFVSCVGCVAYVACVALAGNPT